MTTKGLLRIGGGFHQIDDEVIKIILYKIIVSNVCHSIQ